jgi:hypothetical protein
MFQITASTFKAQVAFSTNIFSGFQALLVAREHLIWYLFFDGMYRSVCFHKYQEQCYPKLRDVDIYQRRVITGILNIPPSFCQQLLRRRCQLRTGYSCTFRIGSLFVWWQLIGSHALEKGRPYIFAFSLGLPTWNEIT